MSELLGTLYNFLFRAGLKEMASLIGNFASRRRAELWALEEAYYEYGYVEYGAKEAEACIKLAKDLLELLEEVRRYV